MKSHLLIPKSTLYHFCWIQPQYKMDATLQKMENINGNFLTNKTEGSVR